MKVPCILCDKKMETREEDTIITVSWIFDELLQKNKIKSDKNIPRVTMVCKNCWESLKGKTDEKNFFWKYNKLL